MPILNYTTQVDTGKTITEIQKILAMSGALAVITQFDCGVVVGISFRIGTSNGPINYQLPCEIDAVLKILRDNPKVPRRFVTRDQAARVGWRIIKDWIEAQLAIVQTKMALIDQVFLPYAITNNGQPLYARIQTSGMLTWKTSPQE